MKRWTLITIAVGALMIAYSQLPSTTRGKLVGRLGADNTMSVTVPGNRESVPRVVRGRGHLQAVEGVSVFAPFTGQLSKIQLKVGDRVTKGQILVTVRSHELLQRLQKNAAALKTSNEDVRSKTG